ncbi:MAG: AAA family ATPase [Sporolactobacillus sp.]
MQIKAFDVERFGSFEHRSIQLPDTSLAFVCGANEAGKTTLMHYLLFLLFGFSNKSVLRRWGGADQRLGGRLRLTVGGQNGWFERYSDDKSASEVRLADGSLYPLEQVLGGTDRLIYESVFCFDLDGLGHIDKIGDAELNNLLLGAGMAGAQRLGALEQQLAARNDKLFKKSGKVPEINHLMRKLEETEGTIRKWEQRMRSFRALEEQISADERELQRLADQKRAEERALRFWQKVGDLLPLLIKQRTLEAALAGTESLSVFPIDGKGRREKLREETTSFETEIKAIDAQIAQIKAQIAALANHPERLVIEPDVRVLSRLAAEDARSMQTLDQLNEQLRNYSADYRILLERLGSDVPAEQLSVAAIDLNFRSFADRAAAEWTALKSEKERLQAECRFEHEQLDDLENESVAALPPADIRQRSHRQARPLLADALALSVTASAAALAAGYKGGIAAAGLTLLTGLVIASLALFLIKRLGGGAGQERHHLQHTLLSERISQAKKRAAVKDERLFAAERAFDTMTQSLAKQLVDHGYPPDTNPAALPQLVTLTAEARKIMEYIAGMKEERQARLKMHSDFLSRQAQIGARIGVPEADIRLLEQVVQDEEQACSRRADLERQLAEYVRQRAKLDEQCNIRRAQLQALFREAGVPWEADEVFTARAAAAEHRCEQLAAQEETMLRLRERSGGDEALARCRDAWQRGSDYEEEIASCRTQLTQLDQQEKAVRERLIKAEAERRSIEMNDSYRNVCDHYEAWHAELIGQAEKWAVSSVAEWAIQSVKARYRREKLPRVLRGASAYLSAITGGSYSELELGEKGFFVGNEAGGRLPAQLLSRGTAEQVYLSLRLALADTFSSGAETLPLIVDDSFVNFDRERLKRTYRLLSQFSGGRQVIVFTSRRAEDVSDDPRSVLILPDRKNGQTMSQTTKK